MNARTEAEAAALRVAEIEAREVRAIFAMLDQQVILSAQRVKKSRPVAPPPKPVRHYALPADIAALDEILTRLQFDAGHARQLLDAVYGAFDIDLYPGWRNEEAEKLANRLEDLSVDFRKFAEDEDA